MDAPTIPTGDAAAFLHALGGAGPFLFQTYPDRKGDLTRGLRNSCIGTLATLGARLAKANARGAAIAVLVNVNDGSNKRQTGNIRNVRALFVDFDNPDTAAESLAAASAVLAPHIVTETSPGKFHAFWRVIDCPMSDFVRLQRALAKRFNGDPAMADVTRCVRVPGFVHRKSEPFLSKLLTASETEPFAYTDFLRAFGLEPLRDAPAPLKLGRIAKGSRDTTLLKLAAAAHRKGIPEAQEVAKLLGVNTTRCDPPLSDAQVRQVVANAYALPVLGHAAIPFETMDSPAYRALDCEAREVVHIAYRRYDGHNEHRIALAWSECREAWPLKQKAFERARARAVASGLLIVTTPARKPSKGNKPRAALYRLKHVHRVATDPIKLAS